MTTHAELLIEVLQHYRREGLYRLHDFVVMPEHMHILLTPERTLERAIGVIKGGFSYRLGSKGPVWQRGFTDHRIRTVEDFEAHRMYVHQNPVARGLGSSVEQYPFSSAHKRRTSAAEAAPAAKSGGTAEAVPLTKHDVFDSR